MSSAYQAKNQATCNQILKVQEIKVRGQDPQSYSTTIPNNTGVVCILILEPVNAVVDAVSIVDATGVATRYSVSLGNAVIIDSQGGTSGFNEQGVAVSDQGAVKLVGLTSLAADDVVSLSYIVQEHL
jgi:hypothetical protein